MPRLFILCGLPFSGKSTLARAMAERLGIVHVEVDAVHGERGLDLNGEPLAREDWIQAYRRSFRRLDKVLAEGSSAVFDATSYRRVHRQRVARIAAKYDVPSSLIYLDVDELQAKRRRDENRATNERPNVDDEGFDLVTSEMQIPSVDESALIYHPAEPVIDWIERSLRPLIKEQL